MAEPPPKFAQKTEFTADLIISTLQHHSAKTVHIVPRIPQTSPSSRSFPFINLNLIRSQHVVLFQRGGTAISSCQAKMSSADEMNDLISGPVKATPDPPRKRRRPALSCAECRRRKIKCDRNVPCSPCKLSKSTTCTYSPEGISSLKNHAAKRSEVSRDTPQPTSLVSGPYGNKILLDTLNSGVVGPMPEFDKCSDAGPVSGWSGSGVQGSGDQHAVQVLMDRVGKLEAMLGQARIGEGQPRMAERDFMKDKGKAKERPMLLEKENGTSNEHVMATKAGDPRGNLSKTRFFGHSHWMHAFAQVSPILTVRFLVMLVKYILTSDRLKRLCVLRLVRTAMMMLSSS